MQDFSLSLQKKIQMFWEKNESFLFETGWNCLERNIGLKYVGEHKIILWTFFAPFSQIKSQTKDYAKKKSLK